MVVNRQDIKEHDKQFIKQNEIKTIKVSKSLSNLKKTTKHSVCGGKAVGAKDAAEIVLCLQNSNWEARKKGVELLQDLLLRADRDSLASCKGMEELLNCFIEKMNDPHKLL